MSKDLFTVAIESLAFGGDGVAHLPDGRICFVRGAAPGDQLKIELIQSKKKFARGQIAQIIQPGPGRIEPDCPYAANCPGCTYRHLAYPVELEQKQQQFCYFMTRGNLVPREKILPPFAAPTVDFQRNRLKLACENHRTGFRGLDNRTLIPVNQCRLANPQINSELKNLRQKHQIPRQGALYFRSGAQQTLSFTESAIPAPELTDFLPNYGEFIVPISSFFQTNRQVGAELVNRVNQVIDHLQVQQLIELYCGVGIFSILAAERHAQLQCWGCEIDPAAIAAAGKNAQLHQVSGQCHFIAEDAGKFLHHLTTNQSTLLLVDPPRTGLAPEAVEMLNRLAVAHLIYISCAADTLRRDLEKLDNFAVELTGLLDMFPRTAHFESFTLLRKKELTL